MICKQLFYYTTTRNIRELQPAVLPISSGSIIPQQETLGNYNGKAIGVHLDDIIPQQETLGNYNAVFPIWVGVPIIPQQETLGNYN